MKTELFIPKKTLHEPQKVRPHHLRNFFTALAVDLTLARCLPVITERSPSIQAVDVIYPNSSKENLGLTQVELALLRDVKQDFVKEAEKGNILGFALNNQSANNERLTPQEIIARSLSEAATQVTGETITFSTYQIDAPNNEVMPMVMSIGERNLPMISQAYDVQIEGEEKPTTLIFFYIKEEGSWRQMGFFTEQPKIVDGETKIQFSPFITMNDKGEIPTFGMVIASNTNREKSNLITFSSVDGKPVLVETFADGSQITGFLPGNGDFFFPRSQTVSTGIDDLIGYNINPAVTQIASIDNPIVPFTPTPAESILNPPITETPSVTATVAPETIVTANGEAAKAGIPIGAELNGNEYIWHNSVTGRDVVVGSIGIDGKPTKAEFLNWSLTSPDADIDQIIANEIPEILGVNGVANQIALFADNKTFSEEVLLGQPFEKEARETYDGSSYSFLRWSKEAQRLFNQNPEKMPHEVIGLFSIRSSQDGDIYVGIVHKWLNPDGFYRYYTTFKGVKYFNISDINKYVFPTGWFAPSADSTVSKFTLGLTMDPSRNFILDKWFNEQAVPIEVESSSFITQDPGLNYK